MGRNTIELRYIEELVKRIQTQGWIQRNTIVEHKRPLSIYTNKKKIGTLFANLLINETDEGHPRFLMQLSGYKYTVLVPKQFILEFAAWLLAHGPARIERDFKWKSKPRKL